MIFFEDILQVCPYYLLCYIMVIGSMAILGGVGQQ